MMFAPGCVECPGSLRAGAHRSASRTFHVVNHLADVPAAPVSRSCRRCGHPVFRAENIWSFANRIRLPGPSKLPLGALMLFEISAGPHVLHAESRAPAMAAGSH